MNLCEEISVTLKTQVAPRSIIAVSCFTVSEMALFEIRSAPPLLIVLWQNPLYKLFLITSIIKFWNVFPSVFPVHRRELKTQKTAIQRVK